MLSLGNFVSLAPMNSIRLCCNSLSENVTVWRLMKFHPSAEDRRGASVGILAVNLTLEERPDGRWQYYPRQSIIGVPSHNNFRSNEYVWDRFSIFGRRMLNHYMEVSLMMLKLMRTNFSRNLLLLQVAVESQNHITEIYEFNSYCDRGNCSMLCDLQ